MINDRYEEIKHFLSERLKAIDKMDYYEHKFLCAFSLLESFAQEWRGYPTSKCSTSAFCDFVCQHQHSYSFLEDIDPITLYYDFHTELYGKFDLSYLSNGCNYTPLNLKCEGNSKEIIDYLKNYKPSIQNLDHRINNHKYIKLLYKMRSKLSHEGAISSWSRISSHWDEKLPSFISVGNFIDEEDEWELGFPYLFIKTLTVECIESFLEERKKEGKDPFCNNTESRKWRLAWVR